MIIWPYVAKKNTNFNNNNNNMKVCLQGRKLRFTVLVISCFSFAILKVKISLLNERFTPKESSVHAVRIPLPRKSLEKLSEGKGDLCRSSAKQNLKHLDRDFYTSYQSSVLSSRKPFAVLHLSHDRFIFDKR